MQSCGLPCALRLQPCALRPTPSVPLAEALGEPTARRILRQLQQHLQKPWVRLPNRARCLHPAARNHCAIAANLRFALL